MLSSFYRKYGSRLLLLALAVFPILHYHAETIPSNNNIEAWLPEKSEVRRQYDEFKLRFGAEEVILVGLDRSLGDDLIESIAGRIERSPGVRQCWTPQRMRSVMQDLTVADADIEKRLSGLFISPSGERVGVVVTLSDHGIKDRSGAVTSIREVLKYCQIDRHDVNIAGAPVVIDELNRLGGRESNKKFFFISLGICLCLLYFQLRDWRMTGMILSLTMFATQMTVAILKWCGGEMNFVIDALPVMVMVFTLEVCVHLLSYYTNAEGHVDRFHVMFHHAVKPCCLATFTTAIGSVSLCVSEFIPVRQFGWAGTLGSLVALSVGMVLTPAVIAVCPPHRRDVVEAENGWFVRISDWFLVRSQKVVAFGVVASLLCGTGMMYLHSHIDPLEFFPKNSVVLRDVRRIQADLTNTDTIETTVDFGHNPQLASLPFVAKLDYVRQLETAIAKHPRIGHTTSLASMFPTELPSGLALTQLLDKATKRQKDNDFLAGGEQYWRISANLKPGSRGVGQKTLEELKASLGNAPVTLTGISPMIEQAQKDIYTGFWSSFVYAFWSIMLVMIVSLKWVNAGFIGMLPNLAPIVFVFGFLGWVGQPVDISMMMAGSIALGIAVDGSFHMLVRYQEELATTGDKAQATRVALQQTGPPILQSTVIMSIGMLALTFSSFGPTALFGWLMGATLTMSLIGDSVLLPCMLGFFHTKRLAELAEAHQHPSTPLQGPHFLQRLRDRMSLRIFHLTDEDSIA